jgi:hypothetical protein
MNRFQRKRTKGYKLYAKINGKNIQFVETTQDFSDLQEIKELAKGMLKGGISSPEMKRLTELLNK